MKSDYINIKIEITMMCKIDKALEQAYDVAGKTGFDVYVYFKDKWAILKPEKFGDNSLEKVKQAWHLLYDGPLPDVQEDK